MARIKYKEAVGIEAKKGKPAAGRKPEKTELIKLYFKESRSIREAAEILGCSKDMVYRALQEYGIGRYPNTRTTKLERFDLEFIRETVKKKGYRKGAQELGVDKSTLYRYLRRMGK